MKPYGYRTRRDGRPFRRRYRKLYRDQGLTRYKAWSRREKLDVRKRAERQRARLSLARKAREMGD